MIGFLHKLATAEGFDIKRGEIKPFTILALLLKSVMPICFDPNWIVRTDFVHFIGSFGKLDSKFVFTSA